ncbi:MAG: succinyldiaminopimelate transaminase [Betaproteobacteria bacterium]|nr:succinyldiaminopimelate transaminase [Betaproteobacteria bacterium]
MNPNLALLQPYPFQKLKTLFQGLTPNANYPQVSLSIGEPKHATPALIQQAIASNLSGLARYPATAGSAELRQSIAGWLRRRYQLNALDADTQVVPVNGSREALFAFAQTVVDHTQPQASVAIPNPFYQIYEGAALLAGAQPRFLNLGPENGFHPDLAQLPDEVWRRTQLIYVCSPGNPTGAVMNLEDWRALFELSAKHGFVIASDECYSEIYFDEAHPPLGSLQAAQQLGLKNYERLVAFGSLSKRSNVPGMRSGFVAGNAEVLERFLLYRTYHGCAMNPAIQVASEVAWNDEAHVVENRRQYTAKFNAAIEELREVTETNMPDAAFYLWMRTPMDDQTFAQQLYARYNVIVLPGSYLAREARGVNPGKNFVRIALVAEYGECMDAVRRLKLFFREIHG